MSAQANEPLNFKSFGKLGVKTVLKRSRMLMIKK